MQHLFIFIEYYYYQEQPHRSLPQQEDCAAPSLPPFLTPTCSISLSLSLLDDSYLCASLNFLPIWVSVTECGKGAGAECTGQRSVCAIATRVTLAALMSSPTTKVQHMQRN